MTAPRVILDAVGNLTAWLIRLTDEGLIHEECHAYINDSENGIWVVKCSNDLLMSDGNILQIEYCFSSETILRHRLAFIQVNSQHQPPKKWPVPLFRFDYDRGAARNIEHPASHLTLGDFQ